MQRHVPLNLLCILENWFSTCAACIKWGNTSSQFFILSCGIRQGGVLSPYLFAIYIDGFVDKIRNCEFGCYIRNVCMAILLYADDILLTATSVTAHQMLLHICNHELSCIGMSINAKKFSCLRIKQAYNQQCSRLRTIDGHDITWLDSMRYLGIYI